MLDIWAAGGLIGGDDMAVIRAQGKTIFGLQSVVIQGNESAKEIICSDGAFRQVIQESIETASGSIANAYHPKAGTMLQAYATLTESFGYNDIQVEGDIGKIPYKKGVIY